MSIESILSEELNQSFFYIPNKGNAGDSVIESATFSMFDKLNLSYQITTVNDPRLENSIVVLGGGGAIVSENAFYTQVLRECAAKASKVVILPHTVKDIDATIKEFATKLVFLCREEVSYNYVQSKQVRVYLVDDIAFSLDLSLFLAPLGIGYFIKLLLNYAQQLISLKKNKSRLKMIAKAFNHRRIINRVIATRERSSVLMAFRIDDEKTDIAIPEGNFDISALYQLELGNPLMSQCATHMMLKTLSAFDEVHTNRLHVAIVATLLGKKVKFFNNSYFKCKAVYQQSIENKFSNVDFIDINQASRN